MGQSSSSITAGGGGVTGELGRFGFRVLVYPAPLSSAGGVGDDDDVGGGGDGYCYGSDDDNDGDDDEIENKAFGVGEISRTVR
jgi:hypothetical protein